LTIHCGSRALLAGLRMLIVVVRLRFGAITTMGVVNMTSIKIRMAQNVVRIEIMQYAVSHSS
jgi:hypothetical protein